MKEAVKVFKRSAFHSAGYKEAYLTVISSAGPHQTSRMDFGKAKVTQLQVAGLYIPWPPAHTVDQ